MFFQLPDSLMPEQAAQLLKNAFTGYLADYVWFLQNRNLA
jgi:hypothetical protein